MNPLYSNYNKTLHEKAIQILKPLSPFTFNPLLFLLSGYALYQLIPFMYSYLKNISSFQYTFSFPVLSGLVSLGMSVSGLTGYLIKSIKRKREIKYLTKMLEDENFLRFCLKADKSSYKSLEDLVTLFKLNYGYLPANCPEHLKKKVKIDLTRNDKVCLFLYEHGLN